MPKIIEHLEEEIIKQAKRLIQANSVEDLTMRDLAKSCEVALGTLYNYFPTKEALLQALIIEYWGQQFLEIESLLQNEMSFYKKIQLFFDAVDDFFAQYKEMMRQIYVSQKCTVPMERPKVVDQLLHRLESIIEHAQQAGEIQSRLLPNDLAVFMFSNFSSMAKMKLMTFSTFETILRELLKP